MRLYLVKRLVQIVPTVLMITFVVFLMMQSVPGDPVVALLGDAYTEEDAIQVRREYGLLAPASPIQSDQTRTFARPSAEHPLGTDPLGRDMLSRVIYGSRVSLAVGVASVLLALSVGVPLGLIAGYCGGAWTPC